ncbi:rod shape-determining protein MreC [Sphingobium phenoxybenzoativorans]|uniref:Cell shape-determining protein MreC n=1 Tax=Sphingobium phenoxybenzoativorans TaxID=1592790 RepID=A0A975K9L5_9SPHN|nr:rod shape-determining protein MreC [Sphingobium phenoxybenzoativorans]QUT07310.1 rod shape-determining protein MreC [Sphingobium phenoxybenzoativorans]
MARPPSRRPGQNRKAQYSLFASYVVAVTGALAGLLLIIIAMFDPTGFAAIRSAGAEITRPASSGLKELVSGIGTVDERIAAFYRAGSQNVSLRRQVDINRTRLIEAAAIEQENVRLKKLLKLVEEEKDEVATARLISSSSSSTRRLARLNAGRSQGAYPGMPVRAPEGLIGRIYTAGSNTSDVLLLTDSSNVVPVRRSTDNIAGISTGADDGSLQIKSLSAGRNPFKPGDILVTSGTGGLYQPNIPVAIVVRIAGDDAVAVPLASPARVEMVMVQRPFEESLARSPGTSKQQSAGQQRAAPVALPPATAPNSANIAPATSADNAASVAQ